MTDTAQQEDSGHVLLQADNISYQIDNTHILSDVSIKALPGELVGLIGPNGAGKSTLLNILAGLKQASDGIVFLNKKPLKSISTVDRARSIGWLEQMGQIHWPLSVHRLVSLGRFPHMSSWQKISEEDEQIVSRALEQTDSIHLQDRNATTLSGGERARVLLARVLAAEPTLLLADEPVSALDLGHQLQTMDVLRQFANGQRSCVVVLHDLSLAARYCDRLYLLNEGKAVAEGNASTVLSNDNIRDVYKVEVISGGESVPWIVPHKIVY